jgi:HTH-type transcriptional regulator, sugar sensing transcriptional regulator
MNLIDVLKLDLNSVEEEYRKIASVLEKIGMSEYEARAFVGLTAKNHGTAEDIAELAGIPRTSSYKALQSLVEKGFVSSSEGRPTIFHPLSIEELRVKVIEEFEETFDKLEAVKGMLSERGTPQLVFTIAGKKGVLMKIGEMLDASTTRFIISTPAIHEVRAVHALRFKEAMGRGVEVIVITEPLLKVPNCSKIFRKKDLIATDVISDATSAMIASSDLSLCGFSDNPLIAQHLENFMKIVLDKLESTPS